MASMAIVAASSMAAATEHLRNSAISRNIAMASGLILGGWQVRPTVGRPARGLRPPRFFSVTTAFFAAVLVGRVGLFMRGLKRIELRNGFCPGGCYLRGFLLLLLGIVAANVDFSTRRNGEFARIKALSVIRQRP
jgi:hypothetical protein